MQIRELKEESRVQISELKDELRAQDNKFDQKFSSMEGKQSDMQTDSRNTILLIVIVTACFALGNPDFRNIVSIVLKFIKL